MLSKLYMMKFIKSTSREKRPAGQWGGILLVWLSITFVFVLLYQASRLTVLAEIRSHAKGVAIAAAASLSAADLDSIRGELATSIPAFRRVQKQLDLLVQANPDIRYIYTMRRSQVPFSPPSAFEYVVDQATRDHNQDGVIGPDERSEPPGQPYDASHLPALMAAWDQPAVDQNVSPDAPYPDLLSGYAPIRKSNGEAAAIVGVDITAATVRHKLRALRLVTALLWLVVGGLAHLSFYLYSSERVNREGDWRRLQDLLARHELLRRVLHRPERCSPPVVTEPHMVLDRFDLAAASAGGGIFRLFELDQDRMGFFLAGSPPAGPLAALLEPMLDLFQERLALASEETVAAVVPYVDPGKTGEVLTLASRLLSAELPVGQTVHLLYGVLDFATERVRVSAAGCPPALLWSKSSGSVIACGASGPAIGSEPQTFADADEHPLVADDVLILADPSAGEAAVWPERVRQQMACATLPQPLDLLKGLGGRTVAVVYAR
jgi:hypothetical protein